MRKLLTWILVTLGIAAVVRKLRRRGRTAEAPASASETPLADDPADELRRKLAESRSDEPVTPSDAAEGSVDERRAEVHEEGRAALDEMRSSSDDD